MNNILASFSEIWSEYNSIIILSLVILLAVVALIVLTVLYVKGKNKPEKAPKEKTVKIKEKKVKEKKVKDSEDLAVSEQEIAVMPIVEEPKEEIVQENATEQENVQETKEETEMKKVNSEVKKEKKTKPVSNDGEKAQKAVKKAGILSLLTKKAPKGDKSGKKLLGKWTVKSKSDDEFIAVLSASNGEVMLTSEIYTSPEGAKKGISTIIKAISSGEFIVYEDKSKDYYYKLKSAQNRFLCAGEIYKTKDQCLKSVDTVIRIAQDSPIMDEVVDGGKYVDYTPEKNPKYNAKKGFEGKWKIEVTSLDKYSARLYASNGQLMLGTEGVSTRAGAISSMEAVKEYSAMGNFVIDKDKFGRFYYKLRNKQKSVICMGEAYDTLDTCVSALESVRKFASTAILVEE